MTFVAIGRILHLVSLVVARNLTEEILTFELAPTDETEDNVVIERSTL